MRIYALGMLLPAFESCPSVVLFQLRFVYRSINITFPQSLDVTLTKNTKRSDQIFSVYLSLTTVKSTELVLLANNVIR